MSDYEVVNLADEPVEVTELPGGGIEVVTPVVSGPQGPPGASYQHDQTTPAATWIISVPGTFAGRLPAVEIYVAGERVLTDVAATTSTVTITFPVPTAGSAVLN